MLTDFAYYVYLPSNNRFTQISPNIFLANEHIFYYFPYNPTKTKNVF